MSHDCQDNLWRSYRSTCTTMAIQLIQRLRISICVCCIFPSIYRSKSLKRTPWDKNSQWNISKIIPITNNFRDFLFVFEVFVMFWGMPGAKLSNVTMFWCHNKYNYDVYLHFRSPLGWELTMEYQYMWFVGGNWLFQ